MSKPSSPILDVTPTTSHYESNCVMVKVKELEARLKTLLENGAETVGVIMTVTEFRDILDFRAGDPGTQHTVALDKTHQHVSVISTGELPTLKVAPRSGPIIFKFKIQDASNQEKYYPLGIAFTSEQPSSPAGHGKPDPLGRKNFPIDRTHIFGDCLYVTDLLMPQAEHSQYKFSVVFQRERDGKMGIIDPRIEHENNN